MLTTFIISIYNKITAKSPISKIFNISILIVNSGSMYPEIDVGDAIIILKKQNYNVGDIITYLVENKYLVTHRIIDKKEDNFITKGDYNNSKDKEKVKKENIQGKVIFHSKILGWIIKYSVIILIILIFLLII